jgi:WD40 repeat protein
MLGLGAVVLGALVAVAPAAGAQRNGPILFTSYDAIYRVNSDGSGLKRISGVDARSLAAAPNGKQLAFTDGGLKTMKLSGGKPKDILKRYPTVRNFADTYWADWSPNGKQIAFVGHNDQRLYVINANGKKLKYVFPKKRTGFGYPHWSPSGKELAYIDYFDDSSLKIVNVKSGKTRLVYSGADPRAGTPVNFDYAPNGNQIAFYAPYRNWIVNTDGSGLRQISPDAAFVSYEDLSYSPDGTEIVGESSSDLFALDGTYGAASGGLARPLIPDFPDSAFSPAWAPAPKGK